MSRRINRGNAVREDVTQFKKGFSVEEASKETTLSKAYLRIKIRDGELVATRFGRRLIILSDDLDSFLRRGSP